MNKKLLKMIHLQLFEFGNAKIQRQINAANPDVRNKNTTLSALPETKLQVHILSFLRLDWTTSLQKLDFFKISNKVVEILVSNNASRDIQDGNGDTAFDRAKKYGKEDLIELLKL